MNKVRVIFFLAVSAICATSCVTQKQMTYLREVTSASADSINNRFHSISEIVIKPGDELTVFVSALDREAVAPYNLPTVSYNALNNSSVQTTPMLQTHRVDEEGNIEMPVLGKIHVEGLKRGEAAQAIKAALEKQVVNPMVQVNMIGAKVTVMGEVQHPGQVSITNGRLTILDALSVAGDLTPYGRRDNVLVTREQDGKLEFARINLTSEDIFASPYYYLQQNDVIYVSPNKVRAISSTNAGLWISMISTVASAATVIVTVVNSSQNKSNRTSNQSSNQGQNGSGN
ncbi:MAG: polysaccharide biosynthesis/export family protein [Paludibacteraceae bacterium]|nr:polysaccharide biosynthesis/export family protein [Paludibacteraceae bacterium]